MKFRTEIEIPVSGLNIDHKSGIVMLGSCFSEYIAARLSDMKFKVFSNPVGILFNPLSIADTLQNMATLKQYDKSDLEYDKSSERWFSYDFHGSFSGTNQEAVLAAMNSAMSQGKEALVAADMVFITLGTAWVSSLDSNGRVVANCHKQPHSKFVRRKVSVEEIYDTFVSLLGDVLKDKKVVFTISPVRHTGDGLEQNFMSKATLRLAVERLQNEFDGVYYFPAYEIMNDDLRDYRFYGDDLVHPSDMAVSYIWSKFTAWGLSDRAQSLLEGLAKLDKAKKHRVSDNNESANIRFMATMKRYTEDLVREAPEIDFTEELRYFTTNQ